MCVPINPLCLPILAKIFSPLFLVTMVSFLAVMAATGKSPFMEREFLIAFDFMLAMILGLVLYVISARDINQPVNLFDYLNLALILTALLIDAVALSAIIFRLSAFGITPNKSRCAGREFALTGQSGRAGVDVWGGFPKEIGFRPAGEMADRLPERIPGLDGLRGLHIHGNL